jgi:kynurenine formamidase
MQRCTKALNYCYARDTEKFLMKTGLRGARVSGVAENQDRGLGRVWGNMGARQSARGSYILKSDHYQIELLTNLDQVPEAGAIVVATFRKPKRGSGFPARVFAVLPEAER